MYSPHPPCGTGYPSCGFVVFQLCVRAREEGEPAPPRPPVEQDGFPFCHTHTHTHTPCLCEWMAILSPNPPPVEQDGVLRHTHTHWFYSVLPRNPILTVEITPLPGCIAGGPSGVRYGVRHACSGSPQASRLQALVFGGGGGILLGGGGGRERTAHNHIYIYI